YALSAGEDKRLRLWRLPAPDKLQALLKAPEPAKGPAPGTAGFVRFFHGHSDDVTALAVSPDGRRLLSGGQDATLTLHDLDTGQLVRGFKAHEGGVLAVAFTPDGRRALSGGADRALRLWDLETGKVIRTFGRTFGAHLDPVRAVAVS